MRTAEHDLRLRLSESSANHSALRTRLEAELASSDARWAEAQQELLDTRAAAADKLRARDAAFEALRGEAGGTV